jgi:amino acid permease
MIKNLFKNYVYPMAVFSGGIIGVGFLSLPYIAMKTGIWLMLGYILLITVLIIIINLIFCDISLKTPDYKRFPGFAGHYLGKWAELSMLVSWILGTIGVLLVYLLVGSQFFKLVFQPIFSGSELIYVLIYFFVATIIIYFDIKLISKIEFWIFLFLFLSFIFIFIESFSQIKLDNIFVPNFNFQISNLFLPYGPLLFSLWGIGMIPEIEEMVVPEKKRLKTIIISSTIIVAVFYLLFTLLVLSITGGQTEQTALDGLKNFLPNWLVSISLFAATLATITAFVTQGIILKKIFIFDLKIKHWQAVVMTCFTPLILLLIGIRSFIPLISITGGVLLGIDGIIILLMYKKIGGRKAVIYPLSLVFLFGVIYEIIYFVK